MNFKKTNEFSGGCLLTTFEASYNDVKALFGTPNWDNSNGDGDGKVDNEWTLKNADGVIVYIYEWKEYRIVPHNETITYHIGGKNKAVAEELKSLFA